MKFFGLFPLIVYLIISYDFESKNTFNFQHKLISVIRGLSIVFAQGCFYLCYELRVCNSSNPCIFYANFLNSFVCSNSKCCWLLEVVCRIIRFLGIVIIIRLVRRFFQFIAILALLLDMLYLVY